MKSGFRKISRVGSLLGATKWYLSEDCLLAAKRVMYTVEYRRFYLRDLEYIVVWPSRLWLWRLIVPAAVLAAVGAAFWVWVNSTAGMVFCSIALAWTALELALGSTARSSIRTTGTTVDIPVVRRTRRARKVLAKIDVAVRVARQGAGQSTDSLSVASLLPNLEERSEASASGSVTTLQTNGS